MSNPNLQLQAGTSCEKFKCPVCKEYLCGEIFLCTEGHSLCVICTERLDNCPVCRNELSCVRNLSLENILGTILFPCSYGKFGCEVKMLLKDKKKHEMRCSYRDYECLPGKEYDCKWRGRKQYLFRHVHLKHEMFAAKHNGEVSLIYTEFGFDIDAHAWWIISAHKEIFWCEELISETGKTYYIAVHYIGAEDHCKKYYYKLLLTSSTQSKHKIEFITQTHPDYVQIPDLIRDNIGCFSLKHDMAKHFMENGNLKLRLEIMKD